MKHSKHHDHPRGPEDPLGTVRFEFTHPTATSVSVAGSFNGWHAGAKPMHPMGQGRWLKETVLPPGRHEYCLVVDGVWIPDPLAPETAPNPYGGRNSVLRIPAKPGTAATAGPVL